MQSNPIQLNLACLNLIQQWTHHIQRTLAHNGQIPIELGQVFQVNSPGNVTAFRHYAVSQEAGDHVARIWRESDGVKVRVLIDV